MNLNQALIEYFQKKNKEVVNFSKLGSGLVADGYLVEIVDKDGVKQKLVCRQLRSIGLSRDYLANNLGYLLLQHEIANTHPQHIRSRDVVCYNSEVKTISLEGIEQVFQLIDFAEGDSYLKSIISLKQTGLNPTQTRYIKEIAKYMAKIHVIKPHVSSERKMHYYYRHSQDFFGSEVFLDVLDMWPADKLLTTPQRLEIINKLLEKRELTKGNFNRCRMIHSDLHPDNIRVNNGGLKVLDSARTIWGEPADDVASMLANYLYFGLKASGKIIKPYSRAYKLLLTDYQKQIDDPNLLQYIQMYLPVRLLILACPTFFPLDTTKKKQLLIQLALKMTNQTDLDLRDPDSLIK